MKKLSVVMCSWKSPNLLKACIPSLVKSFTVDANILVVLNEGDKESAEYLHDSNINFVSLRQNYGTLAVDFATTMIGSEYVVNTNDDMLFHKGWDADLINIIESNYPASASCHLIEPFGTGNPIVQVDNLGDISCAYDDFIKNYESGKYKLDNHVISYTHPIMVRTSDYNAVGGYSSGFDLNWFPGYGLDDWFPFRLYQLHGWKFKTIASKDSCVYHGISMTNNKLPPHIKNRSGREYFNKVAGMSIEDFRNKINCNSRF